MGRSNPTLPFGNRALTIVVGAIVLAAGSCSWEAPTARTRAAATRAQDGEEMIAESAEAARRLDTLRGRFVLASTTRPRPAIGAGTAIAFKRSTTSTRACVQAVLPPRAKLANGSSATVELPGIASDAVRLQDDASRVAIAFTLDGANDAPVAVSGGMAVYLGALASRGGAASDLVQRVHAEGVEDFVAFESRPPREELVYRVDVSRVPGLRLVGQALEFLDKDGTPRLRVAPPYLVDADGARHAARLSVLGCAYDTSPAPPWGRPVVPPGASICRVRVEWRQGVEYPALLDPSWTTTGSMATVRFTHTSTVLGTGQVLVAGGYDGSAPLGSAELYDQATGTFAATGAMVAARYKHTAIRLGTSKVLVAGGYGSTTLSSAELYDPTAGTFSATGALGLARYDCTATLLGTGKVLVTGGHGPGSAELYDPAAGTFVSAGMMSSVRYGHSAVLLGTGKVLVAGGSDGNVSLASADLYDPSLGFFSPTPPMAVARAWHTATLLASGQVLVAGGSLNGSFIGSAELYDPGSNSFAATGSLVTARYGQTATALDSGKVLLAGGYNGSDLALAELYDPASGTFTAAGSMAHPREGHSATLLGSGKVLVTGGGYPLTAVAELFGVLDGGVCTTGSDCMSGTCDERCCTAACGGVCQTCDDTGACVSVTSAEDPDTCSGTTTCDATGACKKKNGEACTAPGDCALGNCVDGVCCDTACGGGDQTDCQACSTAQGASADGTCGPVVAGHVCRAATDLCDADSTCDGTSIACAANPFKPSTTSCHVAAGACDSDQSCTGASAACPTSWLPATTVCAAASDCLLAASCTGSTGTCPTPAAMPDGTPCGGGTCAGGVCITNDAGSDDAAAEAAAGSDAGSNDAAPEAAAGSNGGAVGDANVPDDAGARKALPKDGCGCKVAGAASSTGSTPGGVLACAIPALLILGRTRRRRRRNTA